MKNLIFLGTEFKKGRGGVASVLKEYSNIFPNARFINTTNSRNYFSNLSAFLNAIFSFVFILIRKKNNIIHIR